MFKCNDCGGDFLEPKVIYDTVPYGNGYVKGPGQECCPYCSSENFEDAEICELCGDSYTESRHDGICESCINVITDRFSELLKSNFTPFEISVINSAYDGRNLE